MQTEKLAEGVARRPLCVGDAKRLLHVSALAAAIVLGPGSAADADSVDFACGGVIQSVVDTHGVLDGSIVPMGRIRCQVHYETPGVDAFPGDPDLGSYFQNPPTGQLRVEIGSYVLEVPMSIPVRFGVLDDWSGGSSEPFRDSFSWSMEGANFPFPETPDSVLEQLRFAMDTLDTSALTSDALPPAPLDIADFPNPEIRRFAITGCRAAELSGTFCVPTPTIAIHGIIDTVPEPGAAASGLACLGVLSALARRSR
jgi:hypothetical protein